MKRTMRFQWKRLLLALGLALLALGNNGCKTTGDDENLSARPWNSPRGWEHGLPSSLNEGR
jgi:hypothetical protein